jgi:hypothetical protein|tara:strand:- start:27 stop:155 length:129 start_codon:yes stop_codon:yes gene_type:complete
MSPTYNGAICDGIKKEPGRKSSVAREQENEETGGLSEKDLGV